MKLLSLFLLGAGVGAAAPAASRYATTILAEPSLLGYWRYGDFSSTVIDSKNGYNGTASGGPSGGVSGPLLYDTTPDTAYNFNGSGSIVLSNTGSPTPSSRFDFESNLAWSVELWFYTGNLTFNTNVSYPMVGNRINGGTNAGWEVVINGQTGVERIYVVLEGSDSTLTRTFWTTTTVQKFTQYHVVITKSTAKNAAAFNCYVNGVLQTQGTPASNNLSSATTVTAAPMYIGGNARGSWTGRLDELSIYNVELTQAQVLNHLANSPYPRGLQTLPPCGGTPQSVIIDSDPGTDTDDYHDQYMWMALAKLGCLNVLGHSIVQVPTYAAASGKLLSTYGGLTNLDYGAYKGSVGAQADNYATSTATQFNYLINRTAFTTATTSLETWLTAAANNSVIIIATGPATNLSDFLDTANGVSLVTSKVSALYWVAGYWPTGSNEANWANDLTGTANLFVKWPNTIPLVMFGIDVGNQISLGAATYKISDLTLTNIVCASNVCTVSTLNPHGLRGGDLVNVLGATVDTDLNGTSYAITYLTTTTFTIATTNVTNATYTDAGLQVVGGLQPYMSKVSNPEAWALYNATGGPKSANKINWSGIAILAATYGFNNILSYGGSAGTICTKTVACTLACGNNVVSSGSCYGWESTPDHQRAYVATTFGKWLSGAFAEFLDQLLKRELHQPWIMPQ